MTPGRKFSTRTSAFAASFSTSARPSGFLASRQIERFPRLLTMASAVMPPWPPPISRIQSPSGGSTLIAAAPCNPSIAAQYGPATPWLMSTTVTPSYARSVIGLLGLDAGRRNDLLPLLHLLGDLAAERLRTVRRRLGAELEELLRHVRLLEEVGDRAVEGVDQGFRRAGRSEQTEPARDLVAGHATL